MSPREVLLTVGSDHHPFGRFCVGWIDLASISSRRGWLPLPITARDGAERPGTGKRQRSSPARGAPAAVGRGRRRGRAGGPMGIVEAQRLGEKPVVIPRLGRLGEVVDDHQVAFCRLLSRSRDGSAWLSHPEDLDRVLDAVTQDPSLGQLAPRRESNASAAAQRFGELVDGERPHRSLKERARDALRRR